MNYAVCSRKLQFEAGPEQHEFFACEEHKPDLEAGKVTCFFAVKAHPLKTVDPTDEISCDLCREG